MCICKCRLVGRERLHERGNSHTRGNNIMAAGAVDRELGGNI